MKRTKRLILAALSIAGAAALIYLSSTMNMKVSVDIAPTTEAEAGKSEPAVHVPIKFDGENLPRNLFVQISKAVNPAVVNISTTQKIRRPRNNWYFGPPGGNGRGGDPFQEFFEQFMGQGMGGGGFAEQPVMSLGTGFIIEPDGLIVTNNHVIAQASEIKVQIKEGSKKLYTAKVVGRDERTDLALIKINVENPAPTTVLGDSDSVEVGEWVAAFGNPYGHGHTMTKGIISAKERDIPGEMQAFPFLQTDASINPGNSGGPLVNSAGEVIGVNSAIDARAQGIGFAIPVNVLKRLLPQLKKGKVTRGFLGVAIADVEERAQKQLKLKTDRGALVMEVTPGSPADKAGIQNYDVILKYDSQNIEKSRDLMQRVAETEIGKSVKLEVLRDGKVSTIDVKIIEKVEDGQRLGGPSGPQGRGQGGGMKAPYDLGITLSQLTPELAQEFQMEDAPFNAVVITNVQEGSPAESAGLEMGDIVLDVNRKRITNPKDAVKAFKRGTNMLRVLRADGTSLIYLDTP